MLTCSFSPLVLVSCLLIMWNWSHTACIKISPENKKRKEKWEREGGKNAKLECNDPTLNPQAIVDGYLSWESILRSWASFWMELRLPCLTAWHWGFLVLLSMFLIAWAEQDLNLVSVCVNFSCLSWFMLYLQVCNSMLSVWCSYIIYMQRCFRTQGRHQNQRRGGRVLYIWNWGDNVAS